MNCEYSVRAASVSEETIEASDGTIGRPFSPAQALLWRSFERDMIEVFLRQISNNDDQPQNTFMGILESPAPIRITERWPVDPVPCADDHSAIMLIRDMRALGEPGAPSLFQDPNVVLVRVLVGPTADLAQMVRVSDPNDDFQEVQVYDVILEKDVFTPEQEQFASDLARDVIRGLAGAMGRAR